MLEIAKSNKDIGELTHIALGKHHLPTNLKQGYKQLKAEIWAKK